MGAEHTYFSTYYFKPTVLLTTSKMGQLHWPVSIILTHRGRSQSFHQEVVQLDMAHTVNDHMVDSLGWWCHLFRFQPYSLLIITAAKKFHNGNLVMLWVCANMGWWGLQVCLSCHQEFQVNNHRKGYISLVAKQTHASESKVNPSSPCVQIYMWWSVRVVTNTNWRSVQIQLRWNTECSSVVGRSSPVANSKYQVVCLLPSYKIWIII